MAARGSGRMKGGIRRLDACVLTVNLTIPIELLRKLRQCSIALDGGKHHLCLEARCVIPAWSSCHSLS